jgi:uncharacterized membrane protein YedE/YeeE
MKPIGLSAVARWAESSVISRDWCQAARVRSPPELPQKYLPKCSSIAGRAILRYHLSRKELALMHDLTPVPALLGGMLIGLAASLLLLVNGRVAGISGITGGLLEGPRRDAWWRVAFLAGLAAGAAIMARALPQAFAPSLSRSAVTLLGAGLLVGYGTRLSNGCTSGHGVCGVSRGSLRSIAATATFIATGAVTVAVTRFWGSGL